MSNAIQYGSVHVDGHQPDEVLIGDGLENEYRDISTQHNKSPAIYVLLLIAGLFILILFDSATTRSSLRTGIDLVEMSSFTIYRDGYDSLSYFDEDYSGLKYSFLGDYVGVIEPKAQMKLYVPDYASDSDNYFKFSVCEPDGEGSCVHGKMSNDKSDSFSLACNPHDEYLITIKEYSNATSVLRSMSGTVICLYVRRELRDLNDVDLGATMDAMFALWSTAEEVGRTMYGENFHNSTYFVEAHHFNAAWQDGDHIHEGEVVYLILVSSSHFLR